MRAELKKKSTYINNIDNLAIMSVTGHMNQSSLESYFAGPSEVQRRSLSTTIQSVATWNQPASTSEPQKELSEAPVSQFVSTVSASLSRNPLSDMNLLTYLSFTVSMVISLHLRSEWLRSTCNFVVNLLKLFISNTIYIEPCQYNSFRYFKPEFQPQFRFQSLNSQF